MRCIRGRRSRPCSGRATCPARPKDARAGDKGVRVEAAAAAGNVEAVAQDVRAGGIAARARAGKALLAKARGVERNEVAGAVGVRFGRRGGEERRADERGHGAAGLFRAGNELVGQPLVLRPGNVRRRDGRNADAGNVLFPDIDAEGKVGGEDELAPRVQPLNIGGGVCLGVAELLCLAEGGRIVRAGVRHGGEHIVRRAVQDALDRSDLIERGGAGKRREPGDAAARGGGAAQRHALLFGEARQLVEVGAHELLVRGDDVLARAHGCAEIAVCRLDAAHDLYYNINRGVAHDLVVVCGHGAGELRARTAGEHGGNVQVCAPFT